MNNNKNSDKDKLDFDFESFQDESSSNNGNMEIPKTLNKQLAITMMSIALLGYYYFNDFSKTKSHKEELEPKQYVISAQHPQDQAVQETDNIPSVHEHPATPQEELKSTDQALPIQNQTESLNSETIKHDDTDSEQHVISDSVHGAYETEGVHQAPASIESDIEKPYSNTEHYDGLAKVSYDDYVYVAENQVQDLSIPIESYEFSVLGDNQEEDADFIENEAALDSNLEHKTQTDEANNDPHLPAITQQSENIAFNSVDILKDAPDLIMIEKSDSVIYAQYAIDATISQHMTVSLDSQDSHEEGVAGKKDHLVEDGAPTISKDNLSDCDDRHDTTSAPKKAPIDQSKDISSAPSKDVQAADMKAVSFENENNVQAGKETKSSSSGTDTVQKDKAVEQSKDISSAPSKDVQAADMKAVSLESENNVQAGKETKSSSSGTDTVQKDKAVEQSKDISSAPSKDVQAADMKAVSLESANNVQAGKETKSSSSGTDTAQTDKAVEQSKDISSAPSKDVQAADMKAVSLENENNVQARKETRSSSSGTDTVQKDKAVEQSKDIISAPSKDVQAADMKAVSLENENNVQARKETRSSSSGTDTVQKDKAVEQSRGPIAQQTSQDGRMSAPEAHDSSMQSTATINHYNRLDMHFAALNAQNAEVQKLMQRVESAIKEVERKDAISAAQIAEMQKEKSASSSNKQEVQSAIKSQSDSEKDAYEHLNKQLLQHQSDTQKMMESQAAKMDKINQNMQDLSQKQTKEMNDRLSQIQADQQRVLKDLQAIISKHQENEKRLEKIESYIAQDLESLSQIDKVKINLTPEYHVHAIIPGRAWIRNHQNVIISVTEGQEIPDLGKIVTIDSKQGIIILSNGQVLRY